MSAIKKKGSTIKHNLIAGLITTLVFSFLIVAWFQPTLKISSMYDLVIIASIELISYIVGRAITNISAGQVFIKILLYAALTSGLITFILEPTNNFGFSWDFLIITMLQVVSYTISLILV